MEYFFAIHCSETGVVVAMDGPYRSEKAAAEAAIQDCNSGEPDDPVLALPDDVENEEGECIMLERVVVRDCGVERGVYYSRDQGKPLFSIATNAGCYVAQKRAKKKKLKVQ